MSKKADNFIDKYIVGKDDWLLKHKEVISKLLDEYEADQLALHNVSQQRELLIAYRTMLDFDIQHESIEDSVDYFLKNKESYL
jgi:hypothetical protein